MSGTSLDGLDVAWCFFLYKNDRWLFEIKQAVTIDYPEELKAKLAQAHLLSGVDLSKLDVDLGVYFGRAVNEFIRINEITDCDFIASHGHTVFHQPNDGYTLQIGNPVYLMSTTCHKVIADFRSLDVALGGQGAPLVPIGDMLLFSNYQACLNLGGFANVSLENSGKRIAWDVCPVNFVMNRYAYFEGKPYDKDGELAQQGSIFLPLFKRLEKMPFFVQDFPKSLGREWVEKNVFPLIDAAKLSPQDVLATYSEHVAQRITHDLQKIKGDVLVTGGGTYNSFLFSRMQELTSCNLVKPNPMLVDFKEALIFAFLGVLKSRNEINVLASVTGARQGSCAGVVYSC